MSKAKIAKPAKAWWCKMRKSTLEESVSNCVDHPVHDQNWKWPNEEYHNIPVIIADARYYKVIPKSPRRVKKVR